MVRITFFCTRIVLLSLCTTFHVKHSTETESTERAFVASYDMSCVCEALSHPVCVCVCLCAWWMARVVCSHFHTMHSRKAFASALRTMDNGFMLLWLLLLLSFSLSSSLLVLLVLCFWFWCASALPPFLSTSEISIYILYTCTSYVGVEREREWEMEFNYDTHLGAYLCDKKLKTVQNSKNAKSTNEISGTI